MARHIQCMAGDTVLHDYGWCFDSMDSNPPVSTGYDCGDNPCPDVPPGEQHPPNIVGTVADCHTQAGSPFDPVDITACPPNGDIGP